MTSRDGICPGQIGNSHAFNSGLQRFVYPLIEKSRTSPGRKFANWPSGMLTCQLHR